MTADTTTLHARLKHCEIHETAALNRWRVICRTCWKERYVWGRDEAAAEAAEHESKVHHA